MGLASPHVPGVVTRAAAAAQLFSVSLHVVNIHRVNIVSSVYVLAGRREAAAARGLHAARAVLNGGGHAQWAGTWPG
ncbi:hypothetical protein CesoFtcFv8_017940 [Champsocephalus esox]|uniref:Uncharacterized protein n=1 Tax=Champsocephalus esox TaxID=159716 RepID=A0AAN8BKH1_9TELE|nr:hypothetical protein CesoFtcFv8_017940 [Champsocephalus esox]